MNGILILDGGMSREPTRLGARLRQPESSALALIETPDIVRDVHREFIEAGATMIGGCCGVGTTHIHRLARRLKS